MASYDSRWICIWSLGPGPTFLVKEIIKCKTLPRWVAGTRAVDGGCCELKVEEILQTCASRYNIEPPANADLNEGNEEEGVSVSVSIQSLCYGGFRTG